MKSNLVSSAIILPFLLVFAAAVNAQDADSPDQPVAESAVAKPVEGDAEEGDEAPRLSREQEDRDRPVMQDLTIEKKITGRLPNGYRNVVTSAQRDDIYKIQKEYNELIELLKIRIELLTKERDRRVDSLLSEEQIEKLRESRGVLESEKKSAKRGASRE